MKPRSFCSIGSRALRFYFSVVLFAFIARSLPAQTTQPFLFASSYDSSTGSQGFVTLLRNSTTGVLTMLPNTSVSFRDPCSPTTIDPTGSFLFAVCGDGVAMYTLDATTGVVAETPSSPYAASVASGQNGVLVAAESTGQYVYLLKVGTAQSPTPSTFTLDTFQIDANTPALVPIGSQPLPFNATWAASAADPARHGIFIFVNQEQGGSSPVALLFVISFDFSTGAATVSPSGLNIGNNARSLAMSPDGGYLALGWGDTEGSLTIYQVSTSNFSMALAGTTDLGLEDGSYGSYTFPDSVFFSPGGNVLYVQAPPANFEGGGLPFLVFDPSSVTQLSTPPVSLSDAIFLNGVMDPQAPFSYVGNPGPTTYGISVYQVDLSTGLPSQPSPISSPFYPQIELTPLFVTLEQGGEGIQGPTLGTTPAQLTFASTITGQTSSAQNITLKSLGTQSVDFTSIQIQGPNAADFSETDNCLASPVLPTNHGCVIAVTYAPSTIGASQATLFITDSAAGSPQSIPLSGTAVAPPPTSPAVTLNPASTLTFPGTPTQGTSTAPQTVTLTNSGSASLQLLSAVLSGFNASDFSISADTCSGSLAAHASCNISLIFSPTAAGVRTTTLSITDNAANSPQSLTITGTAGSAVSITSSGSTTATVSAGQTATFNLQATAGAGFTGALSFSCSGAPFGATCTAPSSLPVTNGSPVSFTVSITTLAASQMLPNSHVPAGPSPHQPRLLLSVLLLLLFLIIVASQAASLRLQPQRSALAAFALSLGLSLSGIACGGGGGGGGGTQSQVSPASQTVATPAIQPAGGTFSGTQTVSISDATSGAAIYYTTDGSTPTSSSPVYSASFSLNSATTVSAMAAASGYTNSNVATAAFQFQTASGTYPITINVTATPSGSGKSFQLNPISLTLVVK